MLISDMWYLLPPMTHQMSKIQKSENFSFFKPHLWSPKDLRTLLFSAQLCEKGQILAFAFQIFDPTESYPIKLVLMNILTRPEFNHSNLYKYFKLLIVRSTKHETNSVKQLIERLLILIRRKSNLRAIADPPTTPLPS